MHVGKFTKTRGAALISIFQACVEHVCIEPHSHLDGRAWIRMQICI